MQHALSFPFPLFCTTTTLFCTTKTSNFLVTHYFYGRIVVCAYPIICFLCSCSLLFSTAAHFHLAGRSLLATSISHFLITALNFQVFLPTKFVSPGAHQMEPPSPKQALGVNPFPSRFIIRTVLRGDFARPTVRRANHNDEMTLLLYFIKQQEIRC